MLEIFAKEEQMLADARELLQSHRFSSAEDEKNYQDLYEEYHKLLKQMMRVVKLSDLMQLELRNLSEKLEKASCTDSLTELYNKRFFNQAYLKEWNAAVAQGKPVALVMLDIDYFKKYNDTYGHLKGDECLKVVADGIRNSIDASDIIAARFGGEEFIILLPDSGMDTAAELGQRILEQTRSLKVDHIGSKVEKIVTVSIGIAACCPQEDDNMDFLLRQVDDALYEAKEAGRNCIRSCSRNEKTVKSFT